MGDLFQELRRRKVFRVAAAYAVAAWLLIQVADVVLPTFGAPEWVNQTVIFIFVVGFPIALILAWAFEISSQGIQREKSASEFSDPEIGENIAPVPAHKPEQKSANAIAPGPQVFLFASVGLLVGALSMYAFLGARTENAVMGSISIPFALQNQTLSSVYPAPTFEVSPDGRKVVYVDGEINMLRLQYTDSLDHRLLEGTAGATNPFFSPDGQWIGFFQDGTLQRVPVEGGSPSRLAVIGQLNPIGATWLEDGRIVWGTIRSGLYTMVPGGGPVEPLTTLDTDDSHRFPSSVKGRSVIFFNRYGAQVWALDLETGEERYLFDGSKANYLDSGHMIYAAAGYLWALSFDIDSLSISGEPTLIRQNVSQGGLAYSVSDANELLYFRSPDDGEVSLMLHTPGQSPRVLDRGSFMTPQFSNDGSSVAVTAFSARGPSILRYEIDSSTPSLVSDNADIALWSPDDASIVFLRRGVGLVRKELEQEGSPEQVVVEHSQAIFPNAWIDGGNTLVYNAIFPETSTDLFALHKDGRLDVLEQDESEKWATQFTSDDEWVAYIFDNNIYVSPYPDFSIRTLVSRGLHPKWSNDKSIYFTNGSALMAVDVTFSPSLSFSEPYQVVEIGEAATFAPRFDVDDEGRVVYVKFDYTAQPPALVFNFSAELN
jgi:serine/threonine-protein kinase